MRDLRKCWIILFVAAVLVALMLPGTKFASFGEVETQHEDFIVETETEAELGQIRGQAAAEEWPGKVTEKVTDKVTDKVTNKETQIAMTEISVETDNEPETEPEPTEAAEEFPIYVVDGDVLDLDLQRFMYEELKSKGIEDWMPYAMLTAYQESSFNVYDVTNGLDYGLLQYRITYWEERSARYGYPGADIFNPYVQIYIYVRQTAERLSQGFSISEVISKHKQSDHGPYDQEYVNQVLGHVIQRIH